MNTKHFSVVELSARYRISQGLSGISVEHLTFSQFPLAHRPHLAKPMPSTSIHLGLAFQVIYNTRGHIHYTYTAAVSENHIHLSFTIYDSQFHSPISSNLNANITKCTFKTAASDDKERKEVAGSFVGGAFSVGTAFAAYFHLFTEFQFQDQQDSIYDHDNAGDTVNCKLVAGSNFHWVPGVWDEPLYNRSFISPTKKLGNAHVSGKAVVTLLFLDRSSIK